MLSSSTDSNILYASVSDEIQSSFALWLLKLKQFIYHKQTGKILGRTRKSWRDLLIYYTCYTAFLIALYVSFMFAITEIIKAIYPNTPNVNKNELLGTKSSPGFGFVPNIIKTRYPIIWYSWNEEELYHQEDYEKEMEQFFNPYYQANKNDYANCETDGKSAKPCFFNISSLEECSKIKLMFTSTSICIILKLNKLTGWKPQTYSTLPDEMSERLQMVINNATDKNKAWIECVGTNIWDNQHMGFVSYYPHQGFNSYYFPYTGDKMYLSPLVALRLDDVTAGTVIAITCSLWTKNVNKHLQDLHIKLFIDI